MGKTLIALEPFDHYLLCMLVAGVNIQQGQSLLIMANRSEQKTVDRIAQLARSLKAKQVEILYYQDFESIAPDALSDKARSGWAFLKLNFFERFIDSPRQALLMERFAPIIKTLSAYSQHALIQSCSSVIPSIAWASSLYPQLSSDLALEKLSRQLITLCAGDQEDYLQRCAKHYALIAARVIRLNAAHIQKLHYHSTTCDLIIGLNDDHVWVGGPQNAKGVSYLPNFPTQEVFTVNAKHQLDGWLKITRPFRFQDRMIESLKLEIAEGKVIRASSDQDIRAFIDVLFADERRRYFGEIALVEQDNPIANLNTVFDCVLLDENAVSHIALGSAYPVCSKDHEQNSQADRVNVSDLHLDLMIGSDDLIVRAYDGKQWFDLNQEGALWNNVSQKKEV